MRKEEKCPKRYYVTKTKTDRRKGEVIDVFGVGFKSLEEAEKWIYNAMVHYSSKMTNFFIRYDKKHQDFILSDEDTLIMTSFKISY